MIYFKKKQLVEGKNGKFWQKMEKVQNLEKPPKIENLKISTILEISADYFGVLHSNIKAGRFM
jgi:hypothetical protein